MSLFWRGYWVVEVFQQHSECGILDLKFGAGQGAAFAGCAVEGMRVLEFLGEAQELERGIDLAWEIGNFGWEHHAVAMRKDCHEMIMLARVGITCHITAESCQGIVSVKSVLAGRGGRVTIHQ